MNQFVLKAGCPALVLFSAVFVSRGIVALVYGSRKKLERISIGQVWRPGNTTPPPAATKA